MISVDYFIESLSNKILFKDPFFVKNLHTLALKYGTDKSGHQYTKPYRRNYA